MDADADAGEGEENLLDFGDEEFDYAPDEQYGAADEELDELVYDEEEPFDGAADGSTAPHDGDATEPMQGA